MQASHTLKVPVVIIGAGACGLTAALAARNAGAEVLALERDSSPSGSTSLSSGFVPASDTRFQRAVGVKDSVGLMVSDVVKKNHGQSEERMVRAICEASGPTIDWLAEKHGIPFQLVQGFLYPGHSVERMHSVPEKTGAALQAALLKAFAASGADLLTSAQVTDVTAKTVTFKRPDGTSESVEYESLVLACSGFGGNETMVREHLPAVADALYFGHTGNQGDAIRWGTALGAATRHLGAYHGHGSVATPHGILVTWALMTEGGIQVNERGERFANEHQGYSEACLPVLRQPGSVAWCVYDERLHQLGMTFPDYRDAEAAGAVRRNFMIDGLENTLGSIYKRKDPFGRDFSTRPALKPPYYAIKVTGALFHTQGGLAIDTEARVLDKAGRPIKGLFAGGGAAAGVSGDEVWGYLSGNGLLSAVTLGRLAGENAAASLN
jgi:fumarate reductase flavoprotein subunit